MNNIFLILNSFLCISDLNTNAHSSLTSQKYLYHDINTDFKIDW